MKPALLVLTSTYPRWRGDVEPGFVHELSKRLATDYDVHVLAPHFRRSRSWEVLDGVNVHRFRYFFARGERLAYEGGMLTNVQRHPWLLILLPVFMFSQLYSAWRLVRKHKICLVHAHWVIPQGVVARLLKAICPDVIIVVTSHGGDVYGLNGRFLEYLKSNVYNASKVVTVVSMAMADYLRAVLKDSDIRIAPMGVDLRERFVQKQSLDGRRGIIFVGRLVEKKGVGILLDAFSRVLGDYPQVKLTIIGEGPARTALRQKLAALHIEESVHFLGAVPNSEIPELLNQHAIAVVPSVVAANGDQEGLGLVAIEAMGCACAVIASDLPALRDVVDHNINGLLFEVGNANALATCIRQLVEDEDLRCRLAESGRESVLHKFDWNEATERYRKIFSTLN